MPEWAMRRVLGSPAMKGDDQGHSDEAVLTWKLGRKLFQFKKRKVSCREQRNKLEGKEDSHVKLGES